VHIDIKGLGEVTGGRQPITGGHFTVGYGSAHCGGYLDIEREATIWIEVE
jgi:hypothetical protein